jgi:thiol-disulfide isomerase/thioredoxin
VRLVTRLLAAALLLATTACSSLEGTGDKGYITGDGVIATVAAADREDAISFEGETLAGEPLAIEDFRGKPVVVVVWWSGCPPCRKEAPWVVDAAAELGDRAQFVGINIRDTSTAQAEAFERSFGVGYPSLSSPGGEALLAFPGVLGPRTIPAFVILDDRGRVAASIIGPLPSRGTLVDVTETVASETRDG